jgi:ribosomal protein S18 acetylase RimI-like enzyme
MSGDGHTMKLRDAAPRDAAALSRVHAVTWEATFIGQVPDALAEERIRKAHERDWVIHTQLRVAAGGGVLVVAEDSDVAGFCEYGPTEDADDDPSHVGHIMRLYVHPRSQAKGIGRMLVEAACERLALVGHDEATLWTRDDPSNRALGFYARLGWSRQDVRSSEDPPDVRYRRRLP